MDSCTHCDHKENLRTELCKFRVTAKEHEAIKRIAKMERTNVSGYLRKLALDDIDSKTISNYTGFLQQKLDEGMK